MHTPNLDRLAASGTRLSRMYSTTPVCVPQRIAWTTGRYPMNTGCYGNAHPISDPGVPSFVRNLQESGVATALIGKFHNHANYDDAEVSPPTALGPDPTRRVAEWWRAYCACIVNRGGPEPCAKGGRMVAGLLCLHNRGRQRYRKGD